MKTKRLLKKLGINYAMKGKITHLSLSSDHLNKKTAFIALKGKYHDALTYLNDTNLNQVGVVLSYRPINHPKIVYIQNLKYRLSQIVSILYPHLLKNVYVIGICGTCGKTTTATILYHTLKDQQKKVAYIGTGMIRYEDQTIMTNNTTLDPIEFVHQYLQFLKKPDYLI